MVQLDTPMADEHAQRILQQHFADLGRRSGEARRAKRTRRDIDTLIDKLVAQAPALSDGQRARIQTLLAPTSH